MHIYLANILGVFTGPTAYHIYIHSDRTQNFRMLTIELDGQNFEITKDMLTVKRYDKKVSVEEFTPSVIEPSFGIGRILYALFEHCFRVREGDEMRNVRLLAIYTIMYIFFVVVFFQFLSLPSIIAPLNCSVLPLSGHANLLPFVRQICKLKRISVIGI